MRAARKSRGIGVMAVMVLFGCSRQAPPSAREDGAGRSRPERVICATPAITEIVFALGCGDQIAGVSTYATYPPEATRKPVIGGWMNPNRERLLVLEPDLMLTQGEHPALRQFADAYAIPLFSVRLETVADIPAGVETISRMLHQPERGLPLAADLRAALARIRERVQDRPVQRTVLLFGRAPGALNALATAGAGTFLDEVLVMAGGSNLFADAKGSYPQISKESLITRQPDVILELHPGVQDALMTRRLLEDWQEFSSLPAVRDARVHILTEDYLLVPGPRVILLAEKIAGLLHPEGEDD